MATLGRVLLLIGLSIIIGWMLGYLAIRSRGFENAYVTIVNIIESIPVLGFLPIVLAIFIAGIKGSLGVEIAADFLVFDAIAWNIWIGIYQAFKTVPEHLIEVSDNYNFGLWGKLKNVYIPFSLPRVSSDIFPSFADALFYVMVSEVFTVGVTTYKVFGIGSLIVQSTSQADFINIYQCLLVLAVGVIAVTLIFNNLSKNIVAKYGIDTSGEIKRRRILYWRPHIRRWYVGRRPDSRLNTYSSRRRMGRDTNNLYSLLQRSARKDYTTQRKDKSSDKKVKYIGLFVIGIFLAYFIYSSIQLIVSLPASQWNSYFAQTPILLYAMGVDYFRVFIVTAVSFSFAMFLGYYLAIHHKISMVSLPVIQSLSAFPAPAYFPLIFAIVAPFLMHTIPAASTEILVLALCFISTFYYVFFAFLVGVKAIPTEFWELMENYNMSFFTKIRKIVLPATFPYLVTGLSSTINSAWGGLAVGEYWPHIYDNQSLVVNTGMMKIISENMASGNIGLAAWTSLLFAIVVGVYSIVFTRNLMDLARKKYVIEEGIYHA